MLSILFKKKCKVSVAETSIDSEQYEWSKVGSDGEVSDIRIDKKDETDGEFVTVGDSFAQNFAPTLIDQTFRVELPADAKFKFFHKRPYVGSRQHQDWTLDVKVTTLNRFGWGDVMENDINNGTVARVFKQVCGCLERVEANMRAQRVLRCPTMFKVKGTMMVMHDLLVHLDRSLQSISRPWAANGEPKTTTQSDGLYNPQLVQCLAAINVRIGVLDVHMAEIVEKMDKSAAASAQRHKCNMVDFEVTKQIRVVGELSWELDELRAELCHFAKHGDQIDGHSPSYTKRRPSPELLARRELILLGDQIHLFAMTIHRIIGHLKTSEKYIIVEMMDCVLVAIFCIGFSIGPEAIREIMRTNIKIICPLPPLTVENLAPLLKKFQKFHCEFVWTHNHLCQQYEQPLDVGGRLFYGSIGKESYDLARRLFMNLCQGADVLA